MENTEVFINAESYIASLEHLDNSPEMQRFNFYKDKIYPFSYGTRKETDTHVYWSYTDAKPRFENNRLFYTRNNKFGATYDKSKNDFKIWFGKAIYETPASLLQNITAYFKLDWYNQMSNSLQSLLNATMLKNMVKGKITNPRDYVKAYLKTSPYKKMNISPEIMYKVFNDHKLNSPKFFRKTIEYSLDPNHAIEMISKANGNVPHFVSDIYMQAAILNRKVNSRWSESRIKEVHSQWTRDIMEIEIKSLKQEDYNHPPIDLPEGLKLISNNYELFEEGTVMKHCIYTNYEFKIKHKKYFAFRFEKDGVRATLGVDADYFQNKLKFNQMYGIGNSKIADEHVDYCKEFINSEYFQNWYKEEVNMGVQENLQHDDDFAWL